MAKLVVGLGNPGPQYQNTRHNLGALALAKLASFWNLTAGGTRFKGVWGDGRIGNHRVFWLFPQTFMNLSGESVTRAAHFHRIEAADIIVLHDDLDLAPGKVKIKLGGGNAGHNGLKSIQQLLGSGDFVRVRLGIGRPPGGSGASFVLSPISSDEWTFHEPLLAALAEVFPWILDGDYPEGLNRLSQALRAP